MPGLDKASQEKENLQKELTSFLERMPQTEDEKKANDERFAFLVEQHPEAVKSALESTSDSREVFSKLYERSNETLSKLGINLQWIDHLYGWSGGYMTPDGIKKAKEEGRPEQLTSESGVVVNTMPEKYKNFRSWGELHEYLLLTHRFEGLNEEQINEILEAEQDMEDARSIRNDVYSQLLFMSFNRHARFNFGNETQNEGLVDSMYNKLSDASFLKKTFRAKLYGKLQKLRFAPKFLGDKVEETFDVLKNDIKKLLSKSDPKEQ